MSNTTAATPAPAPTAAATAAVAAAPALKPALPVAGDVVLITGASRGIGLGLVERFAEAGATVIATARDVAKAPKLQAVANKYPKLVHAIALDVSDAKSVAGLPGRVAELKAKAVPARIDVLINNAGVGGNGGAGETLTTVTRDELLRVFTTNVLGPWDVSRVLLPLLRQSATPRILNVSSLMGSIEFANSAQLVVGRVGAYRISKSSLNHLSAIQSAEYNEATVKALAAGGDAAKNAAPLITVLTVCPGPVDTDMADEFLATADPAIAGPMKSLQNSVLTSTSNLLKLVASAKANPNPKAVFLSHDGTSHKW